MERSEESAMEFERGRNPNAGARGRRRGFA